MVSTLSDSSPPQSLFLLVAIIDLIQGKRFSSDLLQPTDMANFEIGLNVDLIRGIIFVLALP